jgi:DNA-binding LacI/PurR family transcriptional regulator
LKASPNIRDVAARAGVSISTVSRVLNRSGPASTRARDAVLRAVSETGFRPNSIGRQLKTAKSRTIGVLVPSLKNPIFADAVQGIEHAAEREGYSILLTSSNYAPEKEVEAVDALLSNRVEGLIVTVADEARSPALDLLRREGVPFVLVFNPALDPGPSAITIDNQAAARAIVEQLIAFGHRRIAMIAGRFKASDRSELRRAGYEQALRDHGIDPGPVIEVGFDTLDLSGHCAELCAGDQPPTAVFCSTDMLAIAAIRSLTTLGLCVPDDVSVAGFDGITVGEWIAPNLATVVQPAEEMGIQALRHLLQRVNAAAPPLHLTLPYRLRPGESWGPPPAAVTKPTLQPNKQGGPLMGRT